MNFYTFCIDFFPKNEKKIKKDDFHEDIQSDQGLIDPLKKLLKKKPERNKPLKEEK